MIVKGPPRARIWRPSGSPVCDIAAHELLVDDRLPRRRRVGQRREVASGELLDPHHREVAGRDDVGQGLVESAVGARMAVDGEDPRRQAVDVERHRRGDRGRFDRGQCAERARAFASARARLTAASELRPARSYAASSTPSRRKPGSVSRVSHDAAEEEAGNEQDDHRERDLRAHQRVAQPAAARRGDAGTKRLLWIDACQLHRGRGAERAVRMRPRGTIANASPTPSMLV